MVKTAFNTARVFSKRCFLLMVLILLPNLLFGQESGGDKKLKHSFSIGFGGHYKMCFGNKHITFRPRDTVNPEWYKPYTIYGGFDKHNTFSFEISGDYKCNLVPYLYITTGLGLTVLKDLYTSPSDTVAYYHALHPYHQNVITYQDNIYRFNVPVRLGYEYKFFSIDAGIEIDFLRFYSFKNEYINGEIVKNKYCGYEFYWKDYHQIYPVLNLNFCFIRKSALGLSCSLGSRMINKNTYDFIFKTNLNIGVK